MRLLELLWFPTTVNPIIQFGAIPVFVDVDIQTHNVNVDLIGSYYPKDQSYC